MADDKDPRGRFIGPIMDAGRVPLQSQGTKTITLSVTRIGPFPVGLALRLTGLPNPRYASILKATSFYTGMSVDSLHQLTDEQLLAYAQDADRIRRVQSKDEHQWSDPMTKEKAAKLRYPNLPKRKAIRNLNKDIADGTVRYEFINRSQHRFGKQDLG